MVCVFVCLYAYRRVHTQLGSLALFWVCKDFFSVVVSVGVSNCDKLLGSTWSFVKPGVSHRIGAALTAAKHHCSPLDLSYWFTDCIDGQTKQRSNHMGSGSDIHPLTSLLHFRDWMLFIWKSSGKERTSVSSFPQSKLNLCQGLSLLQKSFNFLMKLCIFFFKYIFSIC